MDSLAAALLAAAVATSPRAALRSAVRDCVSHPSHTPLVFRAIAQLPAVCRWRGAGEGSPFPCALLAELSAVVAGEESRAGSRELPAAGDAVVRLCALLNCGAAKGCSLVGAAGDAAAAAAGCAAAAPLLEPGELLAWVALPALRADYPGSAVSVAVRLVVLSVSSYAAEGAARGLRFPAPRRVPILKGAPTCSVTT